MVKARMSVAEWEKIKSESNIVEKDGEAGRPREDEEVEPMAMPSKNPTKIGYMGAAKGGKAAGQVSEWKSRQGYDVVDNSFEGKHPTLAKAVDIGKRVVGTINKKTGEYVKDRETTDKKIKKMVKLPRGVEDEEDADQEIIKPSHPVSMMSGSYQSAYGGLGKGSYKAVKVPVTMHGGMLGTSAPRKSKHIDDLLDFEEDDAPEGGAITQYQSIKVPNTLPGATYNQPMKTRGRIIVPRIGSGLLIPRALPTIAKPHAPRTGKKIAEIMPRVTGPKRGGDIPKIGGDLFKRSNVNTNVTMAPISIMGVPVFGKKKK